MRSRTHSPDGAHTAIGTPMLRPVVLLWLYIDLLVVRLFSRTACNRCNTQLTDAAICLICGTVCCLQSNCCIDMDCSERASGM
ncbi:hypothetical protein K443DRAFT_682730 [Laccaria amethystina LaAM-08-1]|uniref:E3 ubiquitin-protein ligase UBR-like C-terminal domain-containing protein n=1 Tax=Laccaria amethystina LaAM-08-1 TaxID=1095629 RepID=A0A0C9WUF3_9AGAR|nr:hypothetical protein K443DRAFT_682730 [Laccaria amethystina LaAM-08-1]